MHRHCQVHRTGVLQESVAADEVLRLGDICSKLDAFGFASQDIDGHDEQAIDDAVCRAWGSSDGRPKALVAATVKGKGVPFMEDDNRWHYTRLTDETYNRAMRSLDDRDRGRPQ